MQFGTNHLGHFVLTNRIAPLVKDGERIVALSSGAHRYAGIDLDDPNFDRTPYKEFVAYGRSKSANALFAVALDKRLGQRGVRVASVHPGVIPTELGRFMTPEVREQLRVGGAPVRLQPKTLQQGAATSVWAAVVAAGDEVGGRYCENCGVAPVTTDAASGTGVRPYAQDPAIAEALWTKSEDMVGERFRYA